MAVRVRRAWANGRLAEGGDAVADGLDAGHGRAAAGEGSHQDPERRRRRRPAAGAAGGTTGTGRPPASDRLDNADGQHRQQRDDEQVRRHHECQARLAHAAKIDQRDQRQDQQGRATACGAGARAAPRPEPRPPPRCRRPRPARSRARAPPRRTGRPWCPGSPWRPCTTRRPADRPRSSGGRRSRRPASRMMISVLIGPMYEMPAAPKGINSVSAASGP